MDKHGGVLGYAVGQLSLALALASTPVAGRIAQAQCVEQCCADCNRDGSVTIGEVVQAIDKFLNGCPIATPTPVPTPNPSTCALPATGQTTAYTADKFDGIVGEVPVPDDGTLQIGTPAQFVDNGDGTIADVHTGLVWEKKDDSGSLHDVNRTYVWSGDGTQETIWDWLDAVNAEGGSGFAGHSDWRIPNVNELRSIVDYSAFNLAVYSVFHTGCVRHCLADLCSCTAPFFYWSSTTRFPFSEEAVVISTPAGWVETFLKSNNAYVRAVRGGLNAADPSICPLLATGQTTSYAASKKNGGLVAVQDDGAVEAGAPAQFVDNGDGTISDINTGVMWEKKDHAGGLHDVNSTYLWSGNGSQSTIWDWLDAVNTEIDPIFGGSGFAGYTDWRIPNLNELQSIASYFVPLVFNTNCAPGCSVATCSCTAGSWSSTTYAGDSAAAWASLGPVYSSPFPRNKGMYSLPVRAIRGGP